MKDHLKLEITDADIENIRHALEEMGEVFPDEEEDTDTAVAKASKQKKAG